MCMRDAKLRSSSAEAISMTLLAVSYWETSAVQRRLRFRHQLGG